MKVRISLLIGIIGFCLISCSKDELPAKNQIVSLFNQSDERIALSYIGFSADSTQVISKMPGTATSPLVRFKENNLILEPDQSAQIHNFSDETLKLSLEQAGGLLYYVINIDTLEQVPWEDIRRLNRGVTVFFYRNYQRLEADSFRIVYKKP